MHTTITRSDSTPAQDWEFEDECTTATAAAAAAATATSSFATGLFGPELVDAATGSSQPTVAALDGVEEQIAVYFSAHWCGPCRRFTPELAQTHAKLQADGKKFKVVFVSSDRDQESFDQYVGTMPSTWLAVPFGRRDLAAKLKQAYGVRGIPSVVLLNGATGQVASTNGRQYIQQDPEGTGFPWCMEPIMQIARERVAARQVSSAQSASQCQGYDDLVKMRCSINSVPTVVVLADSCSREDAAAAEAALASVAHTYKMAAAAAAAAAAPSPPSSSSAPCSATRVETLQFAIARPGDALAQVVREEAQIAPANSRMEMLYKHLDRRPPPILLVVDPTVDPGVDTAYYLEGNMATDVGKLAGFVEAFQAGNIPRREWKPPALGLKWKTNCGGKSCH